MEDSDDLEDVFPNPEKDDVFSLRRNLAIGKEVVSEPIGRGMVHQLFETVPELIEVDILLPIAPLSQRVGPDRAQVIDRRIGEFEPYFLERSNSLKAFFVFTLRTAPASSWA